MAMNAELGLGIALMINVFLFLGQVSVVNINPDAAEFFNYEGSVLQDFDTGNYTVTEDFTGQLPEGQSGPAPDEGSIFLDPFGKLLNWFKGTTAGKYVYLFVNTIPNTLKAMGLPPEVSFSLGLIWFAYMSFLAILLLFGR